MKRSAKIILLLAFVFFFLSFGFNLFLFNQGLERAWASQLSANAFHHLALVQDVIRIVRSHYVEGGKITREQLVYGAIRGILRALEDPYSRFMPPTQSRDMKVETSGKFGGLGIIIGERNKRVVVIAPIADTPADKVGMQAGDIIVKVDGKSVEGKSLHDVVDLLRGIPGTPVVVTVYREGARKLTDYKIVRAVIRLPSVRAKFLGDGIGYAYLSGFSQTSAEDLAKVIDSFLEQGMDSFILDLRHNPGGLLDAAVDIGRLFLGKAPIVTVKSRSGDSMTYSSFSSKYPRFPVIVLIDGGSASASEIVAGAIKDNRRGILVGSKTFGKGSVQTVLNLRDGSAIALTTAYYYTPAGICIHKVGIHPDVEVQLARVTEAELVRLREARRLFFQDAGLQVVRDPKEEAEEKKRPPEELLAEILRYDRQLQTAVDILKGARIFCKNTLNKPK